MTGEQYASGERVLRHRFTPSDHLRRELVELSQLPPGPKMPRFFLSSTRTVSLDPVDPQRKWYDDELTAISNEFMNRGHERAYNSMGIMDASAKYIAAAGILRVAFTPRQQREFEFLTHPLTRVGTAKEPAEGEHYKVVVDIKRELAAPEAVMQAREVLGRIVDGIKDGKSTHLYTFAPYDIVGRDLIMRLPSILPRPSHSSQSAMPGVS